MMVQNDEAMPYPVTWFCIWLDMGGERRLRPIEDEIDLRTVPSIRPPGLMLRDEGSSVIRIEAFSRREVFP